MNVKFTELTRAAQSLIIQLGVKECLIPAEGKSADYDMAKLRQVLERCNTVVTERKPGKYIIFSYVPSNIPSVEFSTKDIEQDVSRLLNGDHPTVGLRKYLLFLSIAH